MLAMVVSALTALIYTGVYGQIALALVISLPLLFASAFAMSVSPRQALTPQGEAYAGQVAGLMRYMEDFSEFGDRGVFDTVLWGRYMVYAAAFGISDKLMEQMERAYPQLADPQWVDAHASNDGLVYWSARRNHAMRSRGRGIHFAFGCAAGGGSFGSMVSNSFSSVGAAVHGRCPRTFLRGHEKVGAAAPTFCLYPLEHLPLFAKAQKVSEVPVVVVGFFGLAHHI